MQRQPDRHLQHPCRNHHLQLDYKAKADDTSPTLCKAKTYSNATSCTVDVTFAPLAPGARNGAVVLRDCNTVLNTRYVYGTGVGPQIAYSPSTPVNLATGSGNASFAIDAARNIFIVETATNTIDEIFAAGGYTKIKSIATNLPTADYLAFEVAVDGAGNLFLVVQVNENGHYADNVDEILAAADDSTVKTLYTTPVGDFHTGIVVDSTGDVFLPAPSDNAIEEIPAEGGYNTLKTLVSVEDPTAIAIDSAGDLFVIADYGSSVDEIPAAGGYSTVKTLPASVSAVALAVDAADNVFVTSGSQTASLSEILAAGGYTTVNILIPNSSSNPLYFANLAVDGSGNIFYNGSYQGKPGTYLGELPRSQPPTLDFPTTTVGSESPLSITAQNIGNASLTFSGISLANDSDFAIGTGSGTPPDCTAGYPLVPSAECTLTVDFTPKSNLFVTGDLVLSDNAGNASSVNQLVPLAGTGKNRSAMEPATARAKPE